MKLSKIFLAYLALVEKTSKITFGGMELLEQPNIVGFWHEDSFITYLILKELENYNQKATVLVTEEWRGNVIQEMVEKNKGEVFRVAYSGRTVDQFKSLFKTAKTTSNIIVLAFDGPKGPRHKIKKVAYLLANKNDKHLVGLRVDYKYKLRVFVRWDRFVVPLLFNKIKVQFMDLGKISTAHMQNIEKTNQRILNQLYQEKNKQESIEEETAIWTADNVE
ncbi:hypothetical protein [[Clostridium] polysaccharolyticum]|uniref:Uncharacterized conserved protein, lysophospholipid acyltransferase (LPLAT) superfamily n=1 Tax=[Clostridium] polysaccharolyticum TaxID=29364 RepID=A0A1I0EGC3_9FIRM|nr:hypothetical protein [[Clostridium] polysaccharolyticum]SET44296.1 Uncharacterized conserved protein, lysophospholipid acyltransferase (LPLAT) superfamily [[Clostridium] polysaccharolyticum]